MDGRLTEQQFLASYDESQFPHPFVTTDIVVFTMTETDSLALLLIKRNEHPFQNQWALPGGFLQAGKESADMAAIRTLEEKTGMTDVFLKQLYTFSSPDRDPRTHVISIAYTALVPKAGLTLNSRNTTWDARIFKVTEVNGKLQFQSDLYMISEEDLAFDHSQIIRTALIRLRNRIQYEPDAFELLRNKRKFTIYELKRIFEVILNKELDTSNFRKMLFRNYVEPGLVKQTNVRTKERGRKAASVYEFLSERMG